MFSRFKNLLTGNSEDNRVDFKKLKDDVHSMLLFFGDVISVTASEGMVVKCHSCARKENIKHPKDAIFVVSSVQHQEKPTTTSKNSSYNAIISPNETNVDRQASIGENMGAFPGRPHVSGQYILKERQSVNERKTEQHEKNYKDSARQLKETETKLYATESENFEQLLEDAKRKFDNELGESRKNLDNVIGENEKLTTKIEDLLIDLKNLKERNTNLQEKFDKNKEENENLKKEVDGLKRRYDIEMKQMETEQKNLSRDLDEVNKTKESMYAAMTELRRNIESKEKDKETTKKTLQQIEKENASRLDKIKSMDASMTELSREIKSKQKDIESMDASITKLRRENESKEKDIETTEKTLQQMEKENATHLDKINCMDKRINELSRQNSSKLERINSLNDELKKKEAVVEKERRRHKSNIATLEDEILGLKKDIADWEERTKKTLAVNFHTSLKQSLALPAQQHIEKCLKEKCRSDKVTLELKQYKSPELTPGPILVLCMNVSRLGTDVKEALKGTPGNNEVLVVVLHHKEVHALPSQASDRVLTGEEYKQLGAIVDAAFWTGRGMYECELNKLATEKIYNFVSNFVTQ